MGLKAWAGETGDLTLVAQGATDQAAPIVQSFGATRHESHDMRGTTRRAALGAMMGLAAAPVLMGAATTPTEFAYGGDPRQTLDLYPQPGLSGASMLLFVHGGGWNIGDKRGVNALPGFAERHGLLFASTNYRLTPDVTARECAQDVAGAVAWMLKHGAEHGGDPQRLFIAGHSAGAHLVALVGIDPVYLDAYGHAPAEIAGVIPIDGAGYDAVRQMARPQRPGPIGRRLDEMYDLAFSEDPAGLSPTLLARPGRAYPPFLIFHVESRADAHEQSIGLAEALRAAGGTAEVVAAPGETHMTVNRDFGLPGDPEGERAARFIATGRL
ncbi:MAG: alpha/beta hydrolase [Caulobacteraceae bacterium]|nr:alpha/beta hydrolase [Caulobacteraceae bacterium]